MTANKSCIIAAMKNPVFKAFVIVIMVLAFAAGIGMYTSSYYSNKLNTNTTTDIPGLLWPNPKQIRPFASIDHNGNVFGLDELQGKWSFIFFGYTHCPDVCPITMAILNQVHDQLAEYKTDEGLQTIFMTVDPERDTTEKLSEYIQYFNKDFIGLGGSMSQVQSLTRQIGVAHMKNDPEANGEYLVDHSAAIFLIDPKARFVAVFSSPHEASEISRRFKAIHKFLINNPS